MESQLQSSRMNLNVENSNPPLPSQPALPLATTKATSTSPRALPQIVLIEDKAPTPRDNAKIASELPLQQNGNKDAAFQNDADDGDEDDDNNEMHNNASQEKEGADPTTFDTDTNNNNKNPTALSTANQTTPALTPPQDPHDDGAAAAAAEGSLLPEDQQQHEPNHPKLHHLTRHWLPPEDRGTSAIEHMGASSVKEAEQKIRGMSQKELRASFQKVYGTPTSSFNNNWLRRKLYEAVGANGGASTKRYRRVGRNDAASRKRELQRAAAAEAEAEAVEALAEIAAGPSMGNSDMAESSSR